MSCFPVSSRPSWCEIFGLLQSKCSVSWSPPDTRWTLYPARVKHARSVGGDSSRRFSRLSGRLLTLREIGDWSRLLQKPQFLAVPSIRGCPCSCSIPPIRRTPLRAPDRQLASSLLAPRNTLLRYRPATLSWWFDRSKTAKRKTYATRLTWQILPLMRTSRSHRFSIAVVACQLLGLVSSLDPKQCPRPRSIFLAASLAESLGSAAFK